ncbi:hypothetical protein D1007_18417 [Hordeum vulgare]|nr:hypothetical protein D1007_18417 [Hordeum vulgare]
MALADPNFDIGQDFAAEVWKKWGVSINFEEEKDVEDFLLVVEFTRSHIRLVKEPKACEIGSQYTQMESQKNQLQLEYDAMKKVLEDKDLVLAKLKEKSESDELKLADFNRMMA